MVTNRVRYILLLCAIVASQIGFSAESKGQFVAPELEPNLGWLNTDRPLRLHDELKGHVVLLDFWTYCCINCMHILPDLERLEAKYADEPFVVVGVHSAKFTNEAQRQSIRNAIFRYGITHPVVVDDDFGIWNTFGARGWPTFVVIGADGVVIGATSGEGNYEQLDRVIGKALREGRAHGVLASKRVTFNTDASVSPPSGLYFPGKVIASPPEEGQPGRLFISDSSDNRVVVSTWPDESGRSSVIGIYGDGAEGLRDGGPVDAQFHDPQGLAYDNVSQTLYVADTKNHAIRAIDLTARTVRTIVGDGVQSLDRKGGKKGVKQGLNSPWDLALDTKRGKLYIAMAGSHQLWQYDLKTQIARRIAGSGAENIADGYGPDAKLAQPSGLALSADGNRLYFADSEVSAIRYFDLNNEMVRTIIGAGLFEYGDVDGLRAQARLQHPLGVTILPGDEGDRLLVADTYNHKIKLVDPAKRRSTKWLGADRGGDRADQLTLDEPGGLSLAPTPAGGELFIADTNNHRIVMVDTATKAWREVVLDGLTPLRAEKGSGSNEETRFDAAVKLGQPVAVSLTGAIPAEQKLSDEAPVAVTVSRIQRGENGGRERVIQRTWRTSQFPVTFNLPTGVAQAGDELLVELSYATCDDGAMICVPHDRSWRVRLTAGEGRSIELAPSDDLKR